MNTYKRKSLKKLVIATKNQNASYDLGSYRGASQGHSNLTPSYNQKSLGTTVATTTHNSLGPEHKTKNSQSFHISYHPHQQPQQSIQNSQHQFLPQDQKQQYQSGDLVFNDLRQPSQPQITQQSSQMIQSQHQNQLAAMIQQQQLAQNIQTNSYGSNNTATVNSGNATLRNSSLQPHVNQQQQQQQHQAQQQHYQQQSQTQQQQQSNQKYSHVLNLLLQQQQRQQNTQQQTQQEPQLNTRYSQPNGANLLYQQINAPSQIVLQPQSTRASDAHKKQLNLSNVISGSSTVKHISTSQQPSIKDFLTKFNKENQKSTPSTSTSGFQSGRSQAASIQHQTNSGCVVNTNPDLTNIYNPHTTSRSSSNQHSSSITNNPIYNSITGSSSLHSTKSNKIQTHNYFPVTSKPATSSRNPSLDKINDSSFIKLKSVHSPKQRMIRTIMPGSTRENSQGKFNSNSREISAGYERRGETEVFEDDSHILNRAIKSTTNRAVANKRTTTSGSNPNTNNSMLMKTPQSNSHQVGSHLPSSGINSKKDHQIRTRNSIEALQDILQPQVQMTQNARMSHSKDSKKQLSINTNANPNMYNLPTTNSFTTTHAQQIHQQKRIIQKRDETQRKQSQHQQGLGIGENSLIVQSSFTSDGNRYSLQIPTNQTLGSVGSSGQKGFKNLTDSNSQENSCLHKYQPTQISDSDALKNISQTQPVESTGGISSERTPLQILPKSNKPLQNSIMPSSTTNSGSSAAPVGIAQFQQKKNQFSTIQTSNKVISPQQQSERVVTAAAPPSSTTNAAAIAIVPPIESQKQNLMTASETPLNKVYSVNEKKNFDDARTRNTERSNESPPALDWSSVKTPITPIEALAKYQRYLTVEEKKEIMDFKRIYFIGHLAKKVTDPTIIQKQQQNQETGGDFMINVADHIAYRYEILDLLGKGSFGQVLKVFDHKNKEVVALKIIRNKQKFHEQALIELNILSYIKEKDYENQTNIVKIREFLVFRNQVCLAFELLSINLYDLLRSNQFQGLSIELIRRIAIQLLNAISFLRENNIIHCDLKPENILLKQPNKSGIKIADFGSSCFDDQVMYTYIQSRYYRSPEVILGIPYGGEIDMWSFGCIIAELFIGYPIFPGEDENEQMLYIMELIGAPDSEFLKKCSRKKYFFDEHNQPLSIPNSRGKIRVPNSKTFKNIFGSEDENFIDFVRQCLVWEPSKRQTPHNALLHPWILEGLPSEIRDQHIVYLQNKELESASMHEFHRQSCMEAQYNADLQSAAMALAVQKIYKNIQKKKPAEHQKAPPQSANTISYVSNDLSDNHVADHD